MTPAQRLKQLQEQRGAKLKEASGLVEKARTENRQNSPEELNKIEGLHSEIEGIDHQQLTEARQLALESHASEQRKAHEARELTESFSLGRMLKRAYNGEAQDGADLEVLQEGLKEAAEAGIDVNKRAILIPAFAARQVRNRQIRREQRDLTATSGTTLQYGGVSIQTDVTPVYDAFFDRSVVRSLGATVLEGLSGNLKLPRIVKDTAALKKTENEGATEATPTMSALDLSPNRLPSFVEVSNQLFKQSNSAIEAVVRSYLFNDLNAVMEKGIISGGGTSEPVGITGTSGIGSVVGGANGAAPLWDDIVNLEREVDVDNALLGNLHYLFSGKVRAKLKTTLVTATYGDRHIIDERGGLNMLNGYSYGVTNACPDTLTKGSSGAACSAIIFGNFSDLIVGFWGGIEFLINPYSLDTTGLTRINAAAYYDSGVVRPVSFSAMLDALAA